MAKHTYRLLMEYDGQVFSGFQRQSPEKGLVTIQDTLENILSMVFAEKIKVTVAGRTDAGVHALGQMVSFCATNWRSPKAILNGLNSLLPGSIRLLEAASVPERFHARFSASGRIYEYYIAPNCRREVFFSSRILTYPQSLDENKMNQAAALLLGTHDFSTYGSQTPKDETHLRRLDKLQVTRRYLTCSDQEGEQAMPGPLWTFSEILVVRIEASAFLRRMVRMLTAALIKVGSGQWEVSQPRRILEACDPQLSPPPVPPGGLYLVSVNYAQDWDLETAKI